jgi:hypothetical protein
MEAIITWRKKQYKARTIDAAAPASFVIVRLSQTRALCGPAVKRLPPSPFLAGNSLRGTAGIAPDREIAGRAVPGKTMERRRFSGCA